MEHQTKYFLNHKSKNWNSPQICPDTVDICEQWGIDQSYFKFMRNINNGGFFFEQSLQIFDLSKVQSFNHILTINAKLKEELGDIFKNLFSFAQDIFGNQFVFEENGHDISFLNIEDGSKEHMAASFNDWIEVLKSNLDYFTGKSYSERYMLKYDLRLENRIVPIRPFIIGGEYTIENFFDTAFPKYISYNADIARQVINLEDGQEVKLVLKKRE